MPPVALFSPTWPSPTDPSVLPLFEPMPTRHGCSRGSSRSKPRPLNPCKSPGSAMQGIFRCCIATPDRRAPPSRYHEKRLATADSPLLAPRPSSILLRDKSSLEDHSPARCLARILHLRSRKAARLARNEPRDLPSKGHRRSLRRETCCPAITGLKHRWYVWIWTSR